MDDINELAEAIESWHEQIVFNLELVAESPEDTAILFKSKDGGKDLEIKGRDKKMFKIGVGVALDMFKKLPFSINEIEDMGDDDE